VKIEAFLSKSIVAKTGGLGTPFAAVVVPVAVVTFSVAAVAVVFGRAFGEIVDSIDWVLPSGAETASPAMAAETGIAIATMAARLAITTKRLRIE
jgi:hypothetical protein